MTRNSARGAVYLLMLPALLPLFSGCSSPETPLPGLPVLPKALLSGMEVDVREQILLAHKAAEENPSDPQRSGRVGMLLHAYGHYESATLFYRYAMSRSPSEFRWNYYLGLAQKGAGRNDQAAESLRRALSLERENLPARLQLATTLIDLNRVEESVAHLQEIVQRQPDNPLAHYELGRAYARADKRDKALKSYSQACELAPAFGAAQYALALAYRDRGDQVRYERHAALFEKHKDHRPTSDDPLQEEVWQLGAGVSSLLEKGRRLQEEGRNEEAIAEYKKVLEIRPEHGMAHASLMGLYRHLGRLEEGERQYRTVSEINPNIPEVHYNYGFLLLDGGNPQQAITAFEQALELNPSYVDAHVNLAVLLAGLDRSSRAVVHLRKALETDQNHRLARYNLARLLLQKGETREPIQLLTGALGKSDTDEEDKDTTEIEALLTTAYAITGLWPQAETHGRRTLALTEKYGQAELARTARFDLGKILVQLARYQEAVDLLRPAAELQDDQGPSILFLLATCYSQLGNAELASQNATKALELARRHGQNELAARIEQAIGGGKQ